VIAGDADSRSDALTAEIARIAAELSALPLIASNRERRLALHERKTAAEAELAAIRQRGALKSELARLSAGLDALTDDPANRKERARLLRDIERVQRDLASLGRLP
jgi:hypothetical protein